MRNTNAHQADLQMIVDQLADTLQRNLEDCRKNGAGWTPVQEARFEGAFMVLQGVLRDNLVPCLDAWKAVHAYSREGERLEAEYDPEIDDAP